jgi:hypothetical protein
VIFLQVTPVPEKRENDPPPDLGCLPGCTAGLMLLIAFIILFFGIAPHFVPGEAHVTRDDLKVFLIMNVGISTGICIWAYRIWKLGVNSKNAAGKAESRDE